ncbi:DUF3667 domain-containing protein [Tenacibaculum retecalamus]|uniref:DUF3667 domain-containing protein n=1 Tax=Tenacibaculum retecalamus TaxID=3018315 RepID=UPI0023D921A8|nr:DUF3667 domain-containing protein [Tenacibaculum retecalamus]WBX70973.1 DUF3667 domain-containing protein [Tenacibaculum retecalamus]
MAKKTKLAIIKEPNCLNCGYPFSQDEKFCPECGQKNKGKKITLGSFIREVFAGFFSWDARFWRTLLPLLIKPGKVSKDYIDGKRNRYSNPFRFYLTVSVIFFLIIGMTKSYDKFNELQYGKSSNKVTSQIKIDENGVKALEVDLDSIQDAVFKELDKKDSVNAKLINQKIDSLKVGGNSKQSMMNIGFDESDSLIKLMKFQKEHPKVSIDNALDSLQMKKTFGNRFLYSRTGVFNTFISKESETQKFYRQILSYASIALFILLPIFTLFLRILYIRRKFTYVEHLVFVFHTQTVFFLLLSIFYLIGYFKDAEYLLGIFLILFTLYLFMAMKKFYGQGYFKTFFKFIMANFVFFFLALLGSFAISFIAFALY